MPELLKTERNPLRGAEIWTVHRLDVKVGLRGVPGVAASTDLIACVHPVAGRHLDGASLKVHESHAMRPLGNLDDDVVSRDGGKSLPNSLGLTQSVRDASQDGTARHVVGLAVVNGDHGSRNGRAKAWKSSGGSGVKSARMLRAGAVRPSSSTATKSSAYVVANR